MRSIKGFFSIFFATVFSLIGGIICSDHATAQDCPIPGVEKTVIELCPEGQTVIPRGNCLEICIRGKIEKDRLSLSIDQTDGSGFHFEMDNGPTSLETTESRILICSNSKRSYCCWCSCGCWCVLWNADSS